MSECGFEALYAVLLLLTQLQEAISQSTELSGEDKAKALGQL
jgi:hypothetical protein